MNLTAEIVRALVDYDPATGIFSRKGPRGNRRADTPQNKGYRQIWIAGTYRSAHRIAWLYVTGEWPSKHIDHINGNPSDNRISNLRLATQMQNSQNARLSTRSKSGFKGAAWNQYAQKWQAEIRISGKRHHLGYFSSAHEAHKAYCEAAQANFGEFARAG